MKVVDAADVIIEVLDARDPLSCRCLDVERLVRRAGADKKVILLLNKIGRPLFVNPNIVTITAESLYIMGKVAVRAKLL